MDNKQIANSLRNIAALMELKAENSFKIRSYHVAADVIADYPEPLTSIAAQGAKALQEISGIGKAIATTIIELINTGSCTTYEELKKEVPESTLELLRISGIGMKTAQKLFRDYQITSLEQLEAFAITGKLQGLAGLGRKTTDKIIHSIEQIKQTRGLLLLQEAYDFFAQLSPHISQLPCVSAVNLVGAARRAEELVESVDILVTTNNPALVMSTLVNLPTVKSVDDQATNSIALTFHPHIVLDCEIVEPTQQSVAMVRRSSSAIHFASLVETAHARALRLKDDTLCKETGETIFLSDEAALYQQLGFPFIAPELREKPITEIDTTQPLVNLSDIKGDLHMHTIASDGSNTIREMAMAARASGLHYIAITDHTKSSTIANGLNEERLRTQMREIDAINAELNDFRILKGAEVDILSDGLLDLPEDVLTALDFVVASVHSGFAQPRERITQRIIRAFSTGLVNVFAHPTGRLLARRAGYDLDLTEVIAAAREYGVCLELNSNPHRLDLSADNLRLAKQAGVRFIISTDAHSVQGMSDRRYGVMTARRAGLTAEDILNTLPLNRFQQALRSLHGH